jgi:hypothetical protein
MAVHKISVKELISRVRQVFPDAPDTYILNLINDALVQIGMYSTKSLQAKLNLTANQMWYSIGDDANDWLGKNLEANKIYRVDLVDNEGDYIQIPRLVNKDILLMDTFPDGEVSTLTYLSKSADWEGQQNHNNVSPTSTSGSGIGLKVSIQTDGTGNPSPSVTSVTSKGYGYSVGDTVTFTDPGSTSSTADFTITTVIDSNTEPSIERPD